MGHQLDPGVICECGHFYGFGIKEHGIGHVAGECQECDCRKFHEDMRATSDNWCAEDVTW